MITTRVIAVLLIVAGLLGLAYGGFTYNKETEKAKIGSLELTVHEEKKVNIPGWAGMGCLIVGGGLLIYDRKKTKSG
jgi:TRAP-type C4-dicarboxylate transport system permease small subunit